MWEVDLEIDEETIDSHVAHVFSILKKTTDREKRLLSIMVMHACRHDITKDLHEDITLIERHSGYNKQEIIEILKSLTNLGFEYKITKSIHGCEEEGNEREYELLSLNLISRQPDLEYDNLTIFLSLMYFGAMSGKCEGCCLKTLNRLDFSDLKSKVDEEELDAILSYMPYEEDEDNGERDNGNLTKVDNV
jgi:hypothetical protein